MPPLLLSHVFPGRSMWGIDAATLPFNLAAIAVLVLSIRRGIWLANCDHGRMNAEIPESAEKLRPASIHRIMDGPGAATLRPPGSQFRGGTRIMRHWGLAWSLVAVAGIAGGSAPGQDIDLEGMGRRIEAQQARYSEAIKAAKTPDDYRQVYLKLAPENLLIEDLFAFEEKARGTPASISVLHWMLTRSTGVGDPEYPIARARTRVIDLRQEHYLGHADLDLLVTGFEAGVHSPAAEGLLRRAAESPHRHVRAAALYQLASWLGHSANAVSAGQKMLELYAKEPEKYRTQIETSERWLKLYGLSDQADRERATQEAGRLLEKVTRGYADVPQGMAMSEGPGQLGIRRLGDEERARMKEPTYGPLAESLLFELTRLGLDQPAPELVGRDADGREFALGDYRGRVVVLMFSANWCGPCKQMYPDNRKLVETYRGRPFAFLSVMGDQEVETVLESYSGGDITWRVWHDGMQGPIATRWNIRSWPTIYVLDHLGIIRFRDLRGDLLASAVTLLMDECSRDPEALALREAHPVTDKVIPARVRDEAAKQARATRMLEIDAGGRRAESIAFDPAGKLLLTGGWEGNEKEDMEAWRAGKVSGVLQLWDAGTGAHEGRFEGPCGAIFSAVISPDGRLAATAGRVRDEPRKGEVILWDVATRRRRATLAGHTNWVLSAAFSPDGKLLATGGFDKAVKVWEVGSAAEMHSLGALPSAIRVVAFSPDGKLLAAALGNGVVKLWETGTWTERTTIENKDFFLLDAAFSDDSKRLVVAGAPEDDPARGKQTGEARVWDVEARKLDAVVPRKQLVSSAAFSPDGRLLALVDMASTVEVWDLAASKERTLIKRQGGSSGDAVRFLSEGRGTVVVFTTHPGKIAFWKID